MADRVVRVLRAFNGINRDQDGPEKTRYIVPDNASTVEEFLSPEEFEYRVKQGFLSVEDVVVPEPLKFEAPSGATATPAEPVTPRRPRRATADEER